MLKQFQCGVCTATLRHPLSTPCGHNFCKPCLERKFAGITDTAPTARTMRVRVNPKPCPRCKADLAEFMAGAQVNRCAGGRGA
jgi:E3 ubiquitin-protein ligase UHRF1